MIYLDAAKRIPGYIKGTGNFGLLYLSTSNLNLVGCWDIGPET